MRIKPGETLVKLTLSQQEAVEWAIGPMHDHWCTEDGAHARDGKVYGDCDLPRVLAGMNGESRKTADRLILTSHGEISEDLLYRLEEQLPDMARQAPGDQEIQRASGHARKAAASIRRAMREATQS